jgi:hypothetical protein
MDCENTVMVTNPQTPLPSLSQDLPLAPTEWQQFASPHEEAMQLADSIANSLEVNSQDAPEVLPPYPEEVCPAERMGLQNRRG